MSETTNIVDTPAAQEAFFQDVPVATEALVTPTQSQTPDKSYSEEDLRRVREQEKSKLYPQIDSLKEELNILKKEREERQAEAEKLRAEQEADTRKKAEAEMDVRQLLETKEQEWAKSLEQERNERERAFKLLEREREYTELNEYRTSRLRQEENEIIPELLDLIAGNSKEEIEESITGLKDRSSRILDSAQQAMQSARKEMTGSRVTAPPTGPLDTNSDQQQFTADQIAAMSVTEYAKYRGKLLGQAATDRGKGIFG
jgi:DNA repair exonuclease SbcCD ATPase subunit